jgi:hypothetical protein
MPRQVATETLPLRVDASPQEMICGIALLMWCRTVRAIEPTSLIRAFVVCCAANPDALVK